MPDDEDRLRDASGAAGTGRSGDAGNDTSWSEASAPDDISALDKDVAAYHRELRLQRRRVFLHRYVARPGAPILTLLVVALVLAGVVAALLTALRPNRSPALRSAPLAHTAVVGEVGGLLPAETLTAADGTTTLARTLRPGVVALLTPSCNCDDEVVGLAQATSTDTGGRVAFYAVAPTSQHAAADALGGRLPAGDRVYLDPAAGLATRIGINGLTLLIINRDGTIYRIMPDVTAPSNALHTALVSMLAHPTPSN